MVRFRRVINFFCVTKSLVIMGKKSEARTTFRKLYATEIDCRVATVKAPTKNQQGQFSGGGWSILLYKDARVDMKLLDEVYGPMGWKREHQTIDGRLYCTISIYDESKQQWVSKQDVGTESYTEKEKGQASDSFKRAGFNWGIGRELYTAPFIWISAKPEDWREQMGKCVPNVELHVSEIEYEDDNISFIELKDKKGSVRYTWGCRKKDMDAYDIACDEMLRATSLEQVKEVWNRYPTLKNDSHFVELCAKMGQKYKVA